MNNRSIIRGLIITLVVSLMVAGVYAAEAGTNTHNDTTDNESGMYLSRSGEVAHVSSHTPEINCYVPDNPHALNS